MLNNTRDITKYPPDYSPKWGDKMMGTDDSVWAKIKSWPAPLAADFFEKYESIKITDELSKITRVLCILNSVIKEKKYKTLINETLEYIRYQKLEYSPACGSQYIHTEKLENNPECVSGDGKHSASREHNQSTNTNYNTILIIVSIFALIISLVFPLQWVSDKPEINKKGIETRESEKLEEWQRSISNLQKEFPSQNHNIWFHILSGVKTTVTEKPVKPSVFLLLYKDRRTSNCLASKVGKEAVKLLGEFSQEPILIRGEDLKMNKTLIEDYGLFMETYKHDIEKKKVMIVLDLHEIPAVVAQTFHTLCDVENPLVSEAAFLFTMQIDKNEKQKPTTIAEKHLKILWRDSLDIDIMDPLITRVTNSVLLVEWEADLPC